MLNSRFIWKIIILVPLEIIQVIDNDFEVVFILIVSTVINPAQVFLNFAFSPDGSGNPHLVFLRDEITSLNFYFKRSSVNYVCNDSRNRVF